MEHLKKMNIYFLKKLDKFGFLNILKLKYLHDYVINVPISSGEIFEQIMLTGHYQYSLFHEKFYSMVKSDPIFISIGANIGTTCLNAKAVGFSKIVAFEPVKANYKVLQSNLSRNNISASIFNLGVSNKTGERYINLNPTSCGKHSLENEYKGGVREKIQVISLDEFSAENYLDNDKLILWIDVEGHELEVLKGGQKTLHNQVIGGCIELTPKFSGSKTCEDAIDILTKSFDFFEDLDKGVQVEAGHLKTEIKEGKIKQINLGFWNS